MEILQHKRTRLTYTPGEPVDFGPYLPIKHLLPFVDKTYSDFDELLADMHACGYFITDYRRLQGRLDHYNDVLPLMEKGYVIEDFHGQTIIVKRDPGVMHGSIWVVDRDLLRALTLRRVVTRNLAMRHGSYHRDVFVPGIFTLETITERQRELLDERQTSITTYNNKAAELRIEEDANRKSRDAEKVRHGGGFAMQASDASANLENLPEPPQSRRWFPKIEAPAFRKPPRAQPISPDAVLAHDHEGKPITAKEVAAEGRKTLPRGLPTDLVPNAPEDCSDEQWEQLMLIEHVKFRRQQGL